MEEQVANMNPLSDMTNIMPISDISLLVFYLVLAIYVIFTGIFYYHWQAYSTDKRATYLTYLTYGITTVPLILIMTIITFIS